MNVVRLDLLESRGMPRPDLELDFETGLRREQPSLSGEKRKGQQT